MKKLDVVRTKDGFVGTIVKYPSNAHIELAVLVREANKPNFLITNKENIECVLTESEVKSLTKTQDQQKRLDSQPLPTGVKKPVSKLMFKKGDTVQTDDGVIGQVVQWPSNTRIYILVDPVRNLQKVVSKDKIVKIVSVLEGEYKEFIYLIPNIIEVANIKNGYTMNIKEFEFVPENNFTFLNPGDRCLLAYEMANDPYFKFIGWKIEGVEAIIQESQEVDVKPRRFVFAKSLAKHPKSKQNIHFL